MRNNCPAGIVVLYRVACGVCVSGLMNLVDELQALLQHAKQMVDNTEVSNPAKITYTLKQLAKEAVAGNYCLSLCSVRHSEIFY